MSKTRGHISFREWAWTRQKGEGGGGKGNYIEGKLPFPVVAITIET